LIHAGAWRLALNQNDEESDLEEDKN